MWGCKCHLAADWSHLPGGKQEAGSCWHAPLPSRLLNGLVLGCGAPEAEVDPSAAILKWRDGSFITQITAV